MIERAGFGPQGTPGDEDLLLNVSVSVGGYSAVDQCWVSSAEWAGFMSQLRQLELSRRGQADLLGASPDDLKITFAAIDRSGHMAVSGFVGWHRPDGFLQRMEFGFRFDAGLVATLVDELDAVGN